jgi:hypothetical protein
MTQQTGPRARRPDSVLIAASSKRMTPAVPIAARATAQQRTLMLIRSKANVIAPIGQARLSNYWPLDTEYREALRTVLRCRA